MAITAAAVPQRIKGVRLPSFVCTLSDRLPKNGSIKRARTLSIAIIPPEMVSLMWKVFFRISGMMLS